MTDDDNDPSHPRSELRQWLDEEALNIGKMIRGEPRLSFAEWKRRRDDRARTVPGGAA